MITVQLLGGPADGRTFQVAGDPPPSTLNVALDGPALAVEPASANLSTTAAPFDAVEYHLAQRRDGGGWLYVWPDLLNPRHGRPQ